MSMNKEKAANLTNLTLGSVMSIEDVLKAYFTNNDEIIVKAVGAGSRDASQMFRALAEANYEIENEKNLSKKSSYGKIQATIVGQLVTPSNVSFLETNVINSEQIIGEPCPDLNLAGETINGVKQQNMGIGMTR